MAVGRDVSRWHELAAKLGLSEAEVQSWSEIEARIYLPFDAERNIHEQFDGYCQLSEKEIDRSLRRRKGYGRMSANSIVQRALTNHWLHEQGVPDMRTLWITRHYGPNARV